MQPDRLQGGKVAFLYIGPGARGEGFKAMFKLDASRAKAQALAAADSKRFEIGKTAWVATRFSAEAPLAKSIWKPWLAESYAESAPAGPGSSSPRRRPARKA